MVLYLVLIVYSNVFCFFDYDENFNLILNHIQGEFIQINKPQNYEIKIAHSRKYDTLFTIKLKNKWKKFASENEPYILFKTLMPYTKSLNPEYKKAAIIILCGRVNITTNFMKLLIQNDFNVYDEEISNELMNVYLPYSEVEYLMKRFGETLPKELNRNFTDVSNRILKSYFSERSQYSGCIRNITEFINGSWYDKNIIEEDECFYVWLVEILIRVQKGYDALFSFSKMLQRYPDRVSSDMAFYITGLIKIFGWYKEYNTVKITKSANGLMDYLLSNADSSTFLIMKEVFEDELLDKREKQNILEKLRKIDWNQLLNIDQKRDYKKFLRLIFSDDEL